MENKKKQAVELLERYNQNHIIDHLNKIDNKEKLINQINEIDFEEIMDLYNKTQVQKEKIKGKIETMQTTVAEEIELSQKNEYIEVGYKIIKENKFAVVTMAGGQGTRLRT